MKSRLRERLKTQGRLRLKLLIVIAAGGALVVALIFAGIFLYNIFGTSEKAFGDPTPPETVVSQFDWEDTSPLKSKLGKDALSISSSAFLDNSSSGKGINAGLPKKNIDMRLDGIDFNVDGIDVSIDYQREGKKNYLFYRGSSLQMGTNGGKLFIKYRVTDPGNPANFISKNKSNIYTIPDDDTFRSYRFRYDPNSGVGEVFVDGVQKWQDLGTSSSLMYWTGAGDFYVGYEMNGDGSNKTVLDNMLFKSINYIPLPIELASFDAQLTESNTVAIAWSTFTEINNDYFTIERSSNGIDFEAIKTIQGAGNSNSPLNYSFTDNKPEVGINYYRLKQTDFDGKFETFNIVPINLEPSIVETINIVSIGPNPFKYRFNLEYKSPTNEMVEIFLTNMQGQIISKEKLMPDIGYNRYNFTQADDILKGTYFLFIVQNDKKTNAIKVIKL